MSVKLLTEHHLGFLSLKGGCTDLSESTRVNIPLCWKSHVTAQMHVTCECVTGAMFFRFISSKVSLSSLRSILVAIMITGAVGQ